MGYGHEEEVDAREYEMIYTLFYGGQDEEERRREAEGEQPPCDCPPAGDGIVVRILKFIFGEKTMLGDEYDKELERKPYHRHIQQPAHSTQTHNRGPRRSVGSRRSSRKSLPKYPMLAEDPELPPPPGEYFLDPSLKAETLLRLIASVLCAAAVIIFSTSLTQIVKIKEWLMPG